MMRKIKIVTSTIACILAVAALVVSAKCNSEDKKEQPVKAVTEEVVAVYTKPDSTKEIAVMLRAITKNIIYDSVEGKDIIVIDTVWGKPVFLPAIDSLGRPIIDPGTGKQKINSFTSYIAISKDSVNWRIEGIPIEILLKKG